MRIVLTAHPMYSHLAPLVIPVARLLHDAGHDVAVATGPQVTDQVVDAGLRSVLLPTALSMRQLALDPAYAGLGRFDVDMREVMGHRTFAAEPEVFAHNFVRVLSTRVAADLLEVFDGNRPDLVIGESTEYGGYLAARAWDVPFAMLDIGPMAPRNTPEMLQALNDALAQFDLPSIDDPLEPAFGFRAGVIPAEFYPELDRLGSTRYYRPERPQNAPLDPAVAGLPDDRPLVLASLGSNAPLMMGGRPELLETIAETLGKLPVTAVLAIGANRSPQDWTGPRPDNVLLTPFVQQTTLLPAVDVFVTHNGFNSTLESFEAGVPMVSIPMFAEQPGNAARVAELGAGVRLNVEDVTTASLHDAVLKVLDDPSYRARARGMQRRSLALPPLSAIVDDLVAYAS